MKIKNLWLWRSPLNTQCFLLGSRIWQSDAKSHRILIVAKNRRRLGPINLKLTVLDSVWIKEPICTYIYIDLIQGLNKDELDVTANLWM